MAATGGEASARAEETAPIPIVVSDFSNDGDDGPLYRLMEYAPEDNAVNNHEQVRELPVGRATPQSQRQRVRIRVCTRCALCRRPPADERKCRGRQSVEDPQLEVSPPGEPTVCGKCGDALLAHMQAAADKISSRLRVHKRRVVDLLQLWWRTALLWAFDSHNSRRPRGRICSSCMRSYMSWR